VEVLGSSSVRLTATNTRLTFEADLRHAAAPGELSAEPRSLSNVSTAK
jgi:hypothetical protein